MEDGIFANLMDMVQTYPGWLIGMAFAFAFLESLAIIGIFVPGIVLLFIVGAVVGMDGALFVACWLAAAAGALSGDGISYWLGYRYSDRIPRLWPLSKRPEMLAAGQTLFARHGGKGVFIGRFIGPIRPVVPLISGMMGMRGTSFLLYATPACLLWAPLYLLPGMLFGASLELAAEFAGRLALVLLILVLGTWFVVWLTRVFYEYTARRSGWWLRSLIRWSREHPFLGRLVAPLFEPGGREVISVTMLGLVLLASLTLLLTVLVLAPFAAGAWDAERHIAGWATSLRNHIADPLFVALALAGQMKPMAILAGAMTLLLLALRRTKAAWHWLAATAGGWLLAELLNRSMGLIVVQPAFMPALGEVPHRGFVMATVVLGFFAVMLAKDLNARRRKWPYLLAAALLGLIGFAHFYLGLASLSGLLAAVALGLGWVALVGIAYRQRALSRRRPGGLALAFYALAIGIAAINIRAGYEPLLEASGVVLPEREIARQHWQEQGWRELPQRLSRFGRAERARFDFQLAGELERVERQLMAHGWETVDRPDARAVLSLLLERPDPDRLPHLNKDFAGHPDNLIMRRVSSQGDVNLVRFWASGARLEPDDVPIWLGQVRRVRPARVTGGLSRWIEVDFSRDAAVRALDRSMASWWRKSTDDGLRLYAGSSESEGAADSTIRASASSR
ncbi:MAG: VTT domain-containing protein [Wenzhouxiangella sp.]